MVIELIIAILLGHFIGDWLLQPRWMAKSKTIDVVILISHVILVSLNFLTFVALYGLIYFINIHYDVLLSILLINAIIHAIQDNIIWRWYKKTKHANQFYDDKLFYDTIACDQLLHLCTIFVLLRLFPIV